MDIKNSGALDSEDSTWRTRRDFLNAEIVELALVVKRREGIRSAARLLARWNVPCWVSVRVLFDEDNVRASDPKSSQHTDRGSC